MAIIIHDKIKALRRELTMRYRVYPRRVEAGKMTQAEADHEIAVAEAILHDYESIKARSNQTMLGL